MTLPIREVHVHVYEGDISPVERLLTQLMAQVDDLTQKFDALNVAVRDLLARESAAVNALQTQINTLIADDEIENSKLVGLSAAADDLRGAVEAFSAQAPIEPIPTDPPVEPTPL